MNRHVLATVLVAVSMVLAGCGAFAGGPSPTATPETASAATDTSTSSTPTSTAVPTATPDPTPEPVPVAGDSPVNATLVWERVESMFPGEYEAPRVSVRDIEGTSLTPPFAAHLGLDEGAETFAAENPGGGYTRQEDTVLLLTQNGSSTELERILAHEYAHAIQDQSGMLERAASTNSSAAEQAIVEGGATYVGDAYAREFLGFSSIDQTCAEYVNGTPHTRHVNGPYCFGGQYFAEKLDSPSDLLNSDLRLPDTTEQVLHPESTDPPANLTVSTDIDRGTTEERERQGELFVRTVLGVELSEERAADAAAGWGNDRLIEVTGATEGYVWILRWDTTDDATEFETAFADHLNARGNETADGWRVDDNRYRLTTIDERTVAVVTGNETFVDAVSVTEQDGNVTVSADRPN